MKLIDLLVQELPKRGGWPDGAESVVQDADDSEFYFFTGGPVKNDGKSWWFVDSDNRNDNSKWIFFEGKNDIADNCNSAIVTRAQYESALAESQKPAWNGEGVPPVGCECECQFLDAWHVCKVLFVGVEVIVGVIDGSERAFSVNHTKFRLIKSEAERKREAAIEAMQREADEGNNWIYSEYEIIYDAIAAGKIPGVKLDD